MNPRLMQILIAILSLGILGIGGYQAYKIVVKPAPAAPKRLTLADYATSSTASVSLTIKGPITATEKHVEQTITIAQATRQLSVFKSYNTTAEYTKSYPNNATAFQDFMIALQSDGFTRTANNVTTSEVGDCPTGTRFVYELRDADKTLLRTWSSSCGNGSFDGQPGAVRSLFQAQIPDYSKLTSDLRL